MNPGWRSDWCKPNLRSLSNLLHQQWPITGSFTKKVLHNLKLFKEQQHHSKFYNFDPLVQFCVQEYQIEYWFLAKMTMIFEISTQIMSKINFIPVENQRKVKICPYYSPLLYCMYEWDDNDDALMSIYSFWVHF